jgi:hypothetical protein
LSSAAGDRTGVTTNLHIRTPSCREPYDPIYLGTRRASLLRRALLGWSWKQYTIEAIGEAVAAFEAAAIRA